MAVPPPPDIMTSNHPKALLRAQMRSARRDFAARAPAVMPPPAFVALLRARPGTIVASYLPMVDEADPGRLTAAAASQGHPVALPHVTDRQAPMRFLRWSPGEPVETGRYGLRQPRADAPELSPDIILTPLVAFDRQGARLGQGAGYYDRAFAAEPAALRIGVAWAMQQVEALPVDPWDISLHAVITEQGWIGFGVDR